MSSPAFVSERGAASSPALASMLVGVVCGVIVTALIAWLAWPVASQDSAMNGAPAAAEAPAGDFAASPVDVVRAVETIAAESIQLLGTAVPIRDSLVASEVEGLVVELGVDEGGVVRPGQVLARLRTATLEQQLAAARADRAESAARRLRADADFSRLASLLERRAISQREYDDAVAERDALAQEVEGLGAVVMRIEDQLERATVRAPFGGRIVAVDVEVGEWVDRGDAIAALVDLSEVEVTVPIAERFISAVEPGFRVDVTFDALPGRSYEGHVKAIVPQAIPEARTFPVLIRVANPGNAIKGGMAARVMAQLGDPQPAILVAKDALVRRGSQVLVYRVRPESPAPAAGETAAAAGAAGVGAVGPVEQLVVAIGPARGAWQVVTGEVVAGDLIVVRGNERLFPGQQVRVDEVRELPVPTADPDRPIAIDPRTGGAP